LFTAEGREWLKAILELNKTDRNITLICICRKALHARVTQAALLTECKVQIVPVVSFASARQRMNECLRSVSLLLPDSRLTLNERKVIKMLLVGMNAHRISRVMNISLKSRALRRFNVPHLNRLYYLRDAVNFN